MTRKTLSAPIDFAGTGLHSGQPVGMTIDRAQAGAGIAFLRTDVDVDRQMIPARYDLVSDTLLCTKLTNDHGVSVGTVEHVMAALAGCGVNDALIAVNGPEVPIMDGSSLPFIDGIRTVGTETVSARMPAIRILSPVSVEKQGKVAALEPADLFEMDYGISFEDRAIGDQEMQMVLTGGAVVSELADARTFTLLSEVEYLRAHGLARGGGLHNAVVVDQGRVLNAEGLRRSDEFVRHKMLDAVGDLAMAGAPIIGRYVGYRAGHEMTNLLLRALFADPSAWCWDEIGENEALCLDGGAVNRTAERAMAV